MSAAATAFAQEQTAPRVYDETVNFFALGGSAHDVPARLVRLMGVAPAHVRPLERESLGTLRLAEALWNLDDTYLAQMGDRLIECATTTNGWRCSISSVCPRCGRRAASKERRANQKLFKRLTSHRTVLVTRTVHAPSIVEGHRTLLGGRRAQGRSSAWQSTFSCGRGRIEAVPVDGRWLVHAHEVCVLRDGAELPVDALSTAWAELVGGEGTFDARMIRPAPAVRTFVPSIFYSTKRKRTELLAFTDDELREWCLTVPRLRWALRFGTTEESSHV